MSEIKKYLDYEGVKHLWSKIALGDYPNNETLITIINAIDQSKADKSELIKLDNTLTLSGLAADAKVTGDAIAAINNAETGILATSKKYTDEQIDALPIATAEALGLIKIDDTTIKVNSSNQLYVAKVSTDTLELGTETLVIGGGNAKG